MESDDSSKPLLSPSMLDVLERSNMLKALRRVKSNKGAPGIDGMTVGSLDQFLKDNWPSIRDALLKGEYKPSPARVVRIPKPYGGTRQLGIPTVLDRLVQQAITQTLTPTFDPDFSESSYGFRPNRNALQAVSRARDFQNQGYIYSVDIDLERFFDVVNHDRLMSRLAKHIRDPILLRLIRKYLKAGLMENGLISTPLQGTPQGSPLSPLLSNIVLDELDKELEQRGHRFCRYADDCQVFVKSQEAASRVLKSLTEFLEGKMRLKVNMSKSCADASWKRSFLGYSFLGQQPGKVRIRCSYQTIKRFKNKVRELTRGHHQRNFRQRIFELDNYLRGWANYYRLSETLGKFKDLDGWIQTRLRMCLFKIWRKPKTRTRNMKRFGCPEKYLGTFHCYGKYWHLANTPGAKFHLNNKFFKYFGHKGVVVYLMKFANP